MQESARRPGVGACARDLAAHRGRRDLHGRTRAAPPRDATLPRGRQPAAVRAAGCVHGGASFRPTSAKATIRILGSVAVGRGEPHARRPVAWLRLSESGSAMRGRPGRNRDWLRGQAVIERRPGGCTPCRYCARGRARGAVEGSDRRVAAVGRRSPHWRSTPGVVLEIAVGAPWRSEGSVSVSGVDETELFVRSPAGTSTDRDRAVIDLGLVERLHKLVVGPVPERLVLVMDGGRVLGRV